MIKKCNYRPICLVLSQSTLTGWVHIKLNHFCEYQRPVVQVHNYYSKYRNLPY